jgi:hypothetical protein
MIVNKAKRHRGEILLINASSYTSATGPSGTFCLARCRERLGGSGYLS